MNTKRNLMELHKILCQNGQYKVARIIFELLLNGSIILGYSVTEWQVQNLLEDMGIPTFRINAALVGARI